jgi:hypothetical protein
MRNQEFPPTRPAGETPAPQNAPMESTNIQRRFLSICVNLRNLRANPGGWVAFLIPQS